VERNVEILVTTAPVDDGCRAHDRRARCARDVDRLACRQTGCDDVFHDKDALSRLQRKAAPKHQLAVLTFGKNGPDAKGPAHLLPDDDATQRGRQYDLGAQISNFRPNLTATGFRVAGMLQDKRTLQEAGTVQSGGQSKVTFEEGTHPAEAVENGIGCN
jgi:hypothetical protein